MTIGIYKLNFSNGDFYIGQSKNIENRYSTHVCKLKGGIAPSKLQNAYKVAGLPVLEIICECLVSELDKIEAEAIEIFDAVHKGLNTFSRRHGGITESALRIHGNSQYTEEQIKAVLLLLSAGMHSLLDISNGTGVSGFVVQNISAGRSHTWLKSIYPDEYTSILNRKVPITDFYAKVVSPTGEIKEVFGLSAFCKEYDLQISHMSSVIQKTRKSHKGWTLYKPNI